ncbi:YraN family protein [Spartinivicinus ruber]|uniref:YraN family protein n=1 Tax=Spartinivicinus ruber TaxID=2683272 RepID=UPI0013D4D977|nr:YraN family protein [Spartinivicinus ruber]
MVWGKNKPTETGLRYEQVAQRHLEAQGLKTIQRNFRCKVGELDLIMQDGESLVFVEVRFRKNQAFGSPASTITPHKQHKIIKAAQYFLMTKKLDMPCRFDVVAIAKDNQQQLYIDWIPNAFTTDS